MVWSVMVGDVLSKVMGTGSAVDHVRNSLLPCQLSLATSGLSATPLLVCGG